MPPFVAEILGTMILIILGDGVVANTLLSKSKGEGGGWIVITTGWGLAVAVAVYSVGRFSGAHINPAVTVSLASIGAFPWDQVPIYIAAQLLGAFLGAVVVFLVYLPHWADTPDPGLKLAVFSTGPAIRNYPANFVTEIIGTFVLVLGVLAIGSNFAPAVMADETLRTAFSTALPPLLVGFLVWAIGLSLGGPTGYAINPARDLGPRIAHAILPIPGKGTSDWAYAWVPVVAPIIGGVLGALAYSALFSRGNRSICLPTEVDTCSQSLTQPQYAWPPIRCGMG
jgi:glycerol uptake facilitator protein